MERKSGDDWVSACRNVVVAGLRSAGRGWKTRYKCVKDDMKALVLHPEWAVFREERLTLAERGKIDVFKIIDDDDDDDHTSSEVNRVGSHDLWCRRQRSGQVRPGAWIPPGRQKVWFC